MRDDEKDPEQDETVATPRKSAPPSPRSLEAPTVSSGSLTTRASGPSAETTTQLPARIGRRKVTQRTSMSGRTCTPLE